MADVHPTAILSGEIDLADSAAVGPGCVLDATDGPVTVGPHTRLLGNVYLHGPLTIGSGNTIYPFVCIGFAPQSLGFDLAQAGLGVNIGDHNVFREGATVHRAMTEEAPTRIGDHNFLMTYTHVGHDSVVGDHCILASAVLLGGHVVLDDRVNIGGHSGVHQFCRLGRGSMLAGSICTTLDVPPFVTLTAINVAGTVNQVGMRRMGLSKEEIEDVRWAYKTIFRRKLPPSGALEVLRDRADRPIVAEFIEFLESSKRGICRGKIQSKRVGA